MSVYVGEREVRAIYIGELQLSTTFAGSAYTGGTVPSWVPRGSQYYADFVTEEYWKTGRAIDASAAFSASGGTPGTAFAIDGDLVSVNAPRITDRGLVVEPAVAQINQRSDNLSDALWTKENVTLGTRADNFTPVLETVTNGLHRVVKSSNHDVVASTVYTVSATIQKLGRRYIAIRTAWDGGNKNIGFDLDTVTVTHTPSGFTAGIEQIGSTYRLWFTRAASASASPTISLLTSNAAVTSDTIPANFAGETDKGFLFGNFDIVAGSVLYSPVFRNAGTAVTKTADAITLKLPSGGPYDLTFVFDDDSTQTISDVPGGNYSVPTNLDRSIIKYAAWGGIEANFIEPANFYIDAVRGSDLNRGDGPGRAWQTLAKVSATTFLTPPNIELLTDVYAGATVQIQTVEDRSEGQQARIFSRNLSAIICLKILDNDAWTETETGVWRIDVNQDITGNTFTTGEDGANIGILVDGDKNTLGVKKLSALSGASADLDWYSDMAQYLYVRSDTDPGERFETLMASPEVRLLGADNGTIIEGLRIVGAGGHAVFMADRYNMSVIKNRIELTGGSLNGVGTAYGNGIEVWEAGHDINIDDNFISDTVDAAISPQSWKNTTAGDGFYNVTGSNNWSARNRQTLEIFGIKDETAASSPVTPVAGTGFSGVTFTDFHVWDNGRSLRPHPNGAVNACVLLQGAMEVPFEAIPVTFAEMHNCGDFMWRPGGMNASTGVVAGRDIPDFRVENSALSLPAASLMLRGGTPPDFTQTAAEFASFVAATDDLITNCTMTIEAADQELTPLAEIEERWRAAVGI